jgi:hypothetical protein
MNIEAADDVVAAPDGVWAPASGRLAWPAIII